MEVSTVGSAQVLWIAAPDANGNWAGFDVDMCRDNTAVLGDPQAVVFIPLTTQTRFTALASGEADVSKKYHLDILRDVDLKFNLPVSIIMTVRASW